MTESPTGGADDRRAAGSHDGSESSASGSTGDRVAAVPRHDPGTSAPGASAAHETGAFNEDYYSRVYNVDGVSKLDIHYWANRYYAKLAERLLKRCGGRRFLDIGCGQGFTLARLGPDVDPWGIEISEYAASRCAQFAPAARIVLGNIDEGIPAGLPEDGFDVVMARYILEHLKDPAAALKRCASLVRPGGYLFFSVPNMQSPGRRIKKDQWFAFLDETHIALLEPPQWLELTAAAGLDLDKAFTDGFWDVPYVRFVPKLIQYGLFSLPTIFAVLFVSTILPMPWGENLIVIARKPKGTGAHTR